MKQKKEKHIWLKNVGIKPRKKKTEKLYKKKLFHYHLHNCDCRFERSYVPLSTLEQCQKVVEVHDNVHVQIQHHYEQLHVAGANFNWEPQQPVYGNVVINVQKRDLILLLAQYETERFKNLYAAYK